MNAINRSVVILFLVHFSCSSKNDVLQNDTALSRKRRYLVFPEGSSFQVVFDLTYPAVALEGNVFTFGNTATMAWELPSTPIFLDKKLMTKDEDKMETTTPEIVQEYYSHDDYESHKPDISWDYSGWGRNDETNYYEVNPFERYRSGINGQTLKTYFHTAPLNNFWNRPRQSLEPIHHLALQRHKRTVGQHIQRRSRREVFRRVEKLLTALSKDGKNCVLKAICQVTKLTSKKGTFWEEIVKAIFRSKFDLRPDEDHYDKASDKTHDCETKYPTCEGHVLSNLFKNKAIK